MGGHPEPLRFGRYQVIEKLGRGGMGVVYMASDPQLNRRVAIKVLPPEESHADSRRRRFLQEARAASALNHPNIVTIYDICRENRQDFIVMECLEGESLDRLLARGKLEFAQALAISRQVGSALSTAHKAGIIHRDLKPGNVFVCLDGTVKVLDFGLAKLAHSPGQELSQAETLEAPLTRVGTVLGTPHYMSPEQAKGISVDARSDIFSFGALLYEMFAGKRPFEGTEPTAVLHDVIYAHPPSPRRLNPEISVALEVCILRALEKDPGIRHPTVRALSEELDAASSGTWSAAFRARLSSAKRKAGAAVQSSRAPVLTAAILLSALLIYLVQDRIMQSSDRGSQVVVGSLSSIQSGERARQLLYRWDLEGNVDAAIDLYEELLAEGSRSAAVLAGLSEAFHRKYRATRDETWLQRSRQAAEDAATLDAHFSDGQVMSAAVLWEQGRLEEAENILDSVVRTDPLNAAAWIWLGNVRSSLKLESEAKAAYLAAISSDPANWEAHILLGSLLWDSAEADYHDALEQYLRAAEIVPDSPVVLQHTGAAYHMAGQFGDAVREFQAALRIQPSAAIYSNLGTAYFFQELYRESAAAFEQAVQMGPGVYSRWANWADALSRLPGRAAEAKRAYRRAVELLEAEMQEGGGTPDLKSRMALYQARAGDSVGANKVLAELEEAGLAGRPTLLFRALLIYELVGDRESALKKLQVALEAGYSREEIQKEPALAPLRQDYRYHEILMAFDERDSAVQE
jgi:eukaryotic-like serine/threonine-protein kinase